MTTSLEKLLRRVRRKRAIAKRRPGAAKTHDSSPSFTIDWFRVSVGLAIIVLLSALMSIHLLPDKISLRVGDRSPREIRAARTVRYFDSVATANAQEAARLNARPVYDTDERAATGAAHTVQQLFARLETARASHARTRPALKTTTDALQPQLGSAFSNAQTRYLLTLPPAVFQKIQTTTNRLIADAMDREIRDIPGDLSHAVQEVEVSARESLGSARDAAIVRAVATQAMRPNRLLNRRKTLARREEEARKADPVYAVLLRDEKIIGPDEIVTQTHLDKFTALGLLNPRLEPTTGVAICLLAAAMVLLVAYYIYRALPSLYANTRHLALLAVIIFLSVFGLKVGASLLGLQFSGGQLGYLGMMSVAAAGMLIATLLDMHLALLIVALLSVQSGLLMNHEIRFTVMTLMSSLVGIFSAGNVRRKSHLLRITGALAAANLSLVWLIGLLLNESLPEMLNGSAWAVGSAAFATFLFWFGVLVLEKPFGILTHTTLLEMSAFDRPLLQQLCAVAPGTYAHSMMVGTLAEAGAQAIGADALLCRVGGYYHDIGKMKRPEFFVENQRRENVHGRLSPSLSALIIIAHVRDGVEMAVEHKLPTPIRDIIAQHHGTTLIRYFYNQALMDNGGGEVAPLNLEERYRYPGPKPQTREAAVVMLADSVEAAARCLDKPNQERLQTLITGLVREKMEDGQFDECAMTFKDVKAVSDAFLHVLTAMMHGRIDYPKTPTPTATGRPMEVLRSDLRPETPSGAPVIPEPQNSPLPLYAPFTGIEPEVAREIQAHRDVLDRAESVGISGEAAILPDETRVMPLFPEVVHGRVAAERAEPARSDDYAAPGDPPPAGS